MTWKSISSHERRLGFCFCLMKAEQKFDLFDQDIIIVLSSVI
ncbi:hypothetical protein SPAR96_0816 [Streptococcus pneumoniae GA47388]|nr:hypothetical protein SPAR86_0718 [Streptococcus pneumoniae GA44511]EHE37157.1 hypothetical protein SPAR96_0816 [Streptococcus pneumoniae GA47388]EHE51070.1 hypothetical protein SPAR118_0708 [Streptococcus pneumoniae GA54644]EJH10962.1 hypothetical protein SPAR61_0921 [Streptococcus pneumoniae GA19998]